MTTKIVVIGSIFSNFPCNRATPPERDRALMRARGERDSSRISRVAAAAEGDG